MSKSTGGKWLPSNTHQGEGPWTFPFYSGVKNVEPSPQEDTEPKQIASKYHPQGNSIDFISSSSWPKLTGFNMFYLSFLSFDLRVESFSIGCEQFALRPEAVQAGTEKNVPHGLKRDGPDEL